ncbi:hypothetical protein S101446_03481 (plasmid) [Komagataeibacter europaeus]|nr:hypothetical protein S101446_03481 [Komagataeibacter europaeus]
MAGRQAGQVVLSPQARTFPEGQAQRHQDRTAARQVRSVFSALLRCI